MKLKIGVDFDNTIACYDHVFAHGARSQKLIFDDLVFSKSDVKQNILSGADGDINWQKLQGQIYGKFMHKASVFPGFAEFLSLAKLRGHQVYIVSHKTEFGHFDEERISLPDEARKWLIANEFVGKKSSMIADEDVFFEPTRELKIERIKALGCTHFIDDLEEVLNEATFPDHVKKYLFTSGHNNEQRSLPYSTGSWRSITRQILSDWTINDICHAVKDIFPELQVEDVELVKGRGNSRIYKLCTNGNKAYALKVYPDLQLDNRKRLETEFFTCQLLSSAGLPVVAAVAKNKRMNWAVYSWIDGVIETADETFINKSVEFVQRLMNFSHTSGNVNIFSNASEACLSGAEIVKQIQGRFDRLACGDHEQLNIFLTTQFLPVFEHSVRIAKQLMQHEFDLPLNSNFLMISPSDFGAHNAILNPEGETYFIDFEYFGWDDPVKLTCDFFWHPAMNLGNELQTIWMQKIKVIFAQDVGFVNRLGAYLPLYGLRWCLILLNEFLPDKIAHRIHANHNKENTIVHAQDGQLNKSKNILKKIKTIINHG